MLYTIYFFGAITEALKFFRCAKAEVLGFAETVAYGRCFFNSVKHDDPKTFEELYYLGSKEYDLASSFKSFLGTESSVHSTDVFGFKKILAKRVIVTFLKDIEDAFEIPSNVDIFWLYWEPFGDEAILGYVLDGSIVEETSNWSAFLALMDLNPNLERYNLGSSDREPEMVLVIDRKYNNAFVLDKRLTDLLAII